MKDTEEIWKDIPGYEGYYQVSNKGKVKGVDRYFMRHGYPVIVRGKIIKQGTNHGTAGGYHFVGLSKEGKTRELYVHRLVAMAFIPNPNNLKYINHINKDLSDNRVENIEWCTQQYNVTYQNAHILRGEKFKKAVIVYNPDGTTYGEFACCADVAKALGIWTDTVHRYMAGKHKCKMGYTFKYKDSQYEPRKKP